MGNRIRYQSVTAFAPATIANLGPGFDVLGLCLESIGDHVRVDWRPAEHGITLSVEGDGGVLPTTPELNTAGLGAIRVLEKAHAQQDAGLHIHVNKGLPLGSGLGSSAASGVASIVAVNGLLGNPLECAVLLEIASECEALACGAAHRDNVAPCLYGGMVLLPPRAGNPVLIDVPEELYCAVVHPNLVIRTADAREILPKSFPLPAVTDAMSQVAGLVLGLQTRNWELVSHSLRDPLVTPVRSSLIRGFDEVMESILRSGALGGGISGSGPTVFALSQDRSCAERTLASIRETWDRMGISSTGWLEQASRTGAHLTQRVE